MRFVILTIFILFFAAFFSCDNHDETIPPTKVFAREPGDSSNYEHLKYDFYLSKSGELCERKLAMARSTDCNCDFEVYYDSIFKLYQDDTLIEKPLKKFIDLNSFVWVDSTEYSKDKDNVFYFHSNSDGGVRVIVDKADPITFKRLCEYRWGIDKNHVFYKERLIENLNIKYLEVLYSPDTSDHFVQYVKDAETVFYESQIVEGADAKSFKLVRKKNWEAEDKNYKYQTGRRIE